MKRLFYLLPLYFLVACTSTREATRTKAQVEKYTAALWQQEPVKPDSISGYLPNPEINLLDALQRKYPGTAKTRVVVRRDTIRLPGKTVTITLPGRVDTVENVIVRDSLLSQIERLALTAKENSELKAAYANLRVALLKELNRRGRLPDTLVQVQGFGFYFTMHVIPRPDGNYDFELVKARQDVAYDAEVKETTQQRMVQTPRLVWYRDGWFYAFFLALVGGVAYGWWITKLRLEDAKPVASR